MDLIDYCMTSQQSLSRQASTTPAPLREAALAGLTGHFCVASSMPERIEGSGDVRRVDKKLQATRNGVTKPQGLGHFCALCLRQQRRCFMALSHPSYDRATSEWQRCASNDSVVCLIRLYVYVSLPASSHHLCFEPIARELSQTNLESIRVKPGMESLQAFLALSSGSNMQPPKLCDFTIRLHATSRNGTDNSISKVNPGQL